jgi:predicted dienelactone hydrolase
MRLWWHARAACRGRPSRRGNAWYARTLVVTTLLVTVGGVAGAQSLPTAHRAGQPQPVGVTTLDLVDASRGRTLTTEVWYPARERGRDTPPRRRHPLVILVHGHCGFRTNYEYLTKALAGHGLIVAAPDVPSFCLDRGPVDVVDVPADLTFLRQTLHDRGGPADRIARVVRGSRTGLVGHSLGGAVAVGATLADPAFLAVVLLAPAVGASNAAPFTGLAPARAVLVMGGTADTTIAFAPFTQPFFDALPPPAYLVRIGGGTHSGFTDTDSHLSASALEAQQDAVQTYASAFFDRYLRGRPSAAARLLRTSHDGTIAVTVKKD